LRYDIIVRIELLRLLRDRWDLYVDDINAFLAFPQARAYGVWFREVRCARYFPRLYRDKRQLDLAFVQRVHETARLWSSIDRRGYDPSKPVRLRSGQTIRTVNGKAIASRYFAGDGCHRISCLYMLGHTTLRPEEYEVQLAREFVPLDTTSVLIERLQLERGAYLRFLSRFYCNGLELDSVDEITRHVTTHRADLLPELQSILSHDVRLTTEPR
jgi:hypothetical protein